MFSKPVNKPANDEVNDYQFYFDQLSEFRDRLIKSHNFVLDYPKPAVVNNVDATTELENTLKYYDVLKKELAKVIPAKEIEEIEQSVIRYTLEDDTFKNLLFIPEYQSEYVQKYDRLNAEKDLKLFNLKLSRSEITENWENRDENYYNITPALFIASAFVVGIPIVLGKLIAGIADDIISHIRIAIKDKQIVNARKEYEDGVKTIQSDIENTIKEKNSQKLSLKLGFFEASLLRHSKAIEAADQRINPRLASKQGA